MICKYCCQMCIEKMGMEYWESRIAETDVSEWILRYALPHSHQQAKYITLLAIMHTYPQSRILVFKQMDFSRSKLLCYKISRTTFKILMMVHILFFKTCYVLPILTTCWNSTLSCFPLHFPKTCNIRRQQFSCQFTREKSCMTGMFKAPFLKWI